MVEGGGDAQLLLRDDLSVRVDARAALRLAHHHQHRDAREGRVRDEDVVQPQHADGGHDAAAEGVRAHAEGGDAEAQRASEPAGEADDGAQDPGGQQAHSGQRLVELLVFAAAQLVGGRGEQLADLSARELVGVADLGIRQLIPTFNSNQCCFKKNNIIYKLKKIKKLKIKKILYKENKTYFQYQQYHEE